MAESRLIDALNDCIDCLADGRDLDDCLRDYPQYASTLRPMLEAGLQVRHASPGAAEVARAQARVRARIEPGRTTIPDRRPRWQLPYRVGWLSLLVVAAVALGVLVVLTFTPPEEQPAVGPTSTSTPSATATASATTAPSVTPTRTPSATPTRTPVPSSTPSLTPTAVACTPYQPPGWVAYTIQPNDTLSSLAASRGVSVAEVLRVNCLTDPSTIIAGQVIYLPSVSGPVAPPATEEEDGDNGDDGDDDDGDDDGESGHSGEGGGDDDNDNSGDEDDD